MTYLIGKEPLEWGERKVRVKNHSRNYPNGTKQIEQYSAQCPMTQARKRLKHLWQNVYVMSCEEKDCHCEHFIDIVSGNEIRGNVWQVSSELKSPESKLTGYNSPPPNFKIVDANGFSLGFGYVKYGIEYRQFIHEPTAKYSLSWTLFYINPEMTEGVAMAWVVETKTWVYAKFVACEHEWRAMTTSELEENHMQTGQGTASTVCDKCGLIHFVDSSD